MSSSPLIATPAAFVTEQVVAFGQVGGTSTTVDLLTPLPVSDQPFRSAGAIIPDVDQVPRRAILIDCSASGRVALKLADDSVLSVPAATGLSILPFAVKTVLSATTTATASYASLG